MISSFSSLKLRPVEPIRKTLGPRGYSPASLVGLHWYGPVSVVGSREWASLEGLQQVDLGFAGPYG